MRGGLAIIFLGATSAAAQGLVFSDDFEGGALPGRWDAVTGPLPGASISPEPTAAHRGGEGLRVTDDVENDGGSESVAAVRFNYPAKSKGDLYLRGWVRVSPVDAGSVHPLMIHGTVPSETVAEVVVNASGAHVSGFDTHG